MSKNYVTFIDQNGRNIIGEEVVSAATPTTITVQNPTMIIVHTQQNNQLTVQLVPLFLGEFIESTPTTKRNFAYEYCKSAIALGKGFNIDPKIISQYDRVVNQSFNFADAKAEVAPEVVKLFNE
jgi:hypothetical protein